jgi:hypothetical protein
MSDERRELGTTRALAARHVVAPGVVRREFFCGSCFEKLMDNVPEGEARCPRCGELNQVVFAPRAGDTGSRDAARP